MQTTWRGLASTLFLVGAVGVLTTGCVVASGDDNGWRRHRDRVEHRYDRRDDVYEHRDGRWQYREPAY